jgi:hypothetical protein
MQPAPRREAFFSALTNSYPPLEARRAKTLPRKPAVRGCCTPWCLPGGRDRLVTLCVARPAGSQALATSNSVGHGRPGIAGHSRRGHRRARNALPQLRRPATIPALRVSSNGRPPPITRSPISFNSRGPPPPPHTHTPHSLPTALCMSRGRSSFLACTQSSRPPALEYLLPVTPIRRG